MRSPSHTSRRVLIVGGGISGLSTAVRLAQSGLPVTVLEASRIGHGASTRNQGWLYSGGWFALQQPELARMCYESLRRTLLYFPECVEPGHSGMGYLFDRPDTPVDEWAAAWKKAGIPVHELPRSWLKDRFAESAAPEVRQAFLLPDRSIRSDLLLYRLAEEAENAGAEVRTATPVSALIRNGDCVEGLVTGTGETIPARLVILAGNASGLTLLPWPDHTEPGAQSEHELVALKTHLVAVRPEADSWPFCVVDADGFNHLPHGSTSVFGTGRWFFVADGRDEGVMPGEIDRLWERIGHYMPGLDRRRREIVEWAGTTVQAMHVEQVEPGRIPWPTVIDHEQELPATHNLISLFPGRASLWAELAEAARKTVLEKVEGPSHRVASPPWTFPSAGESGCHPPSPVGSK